MTRSRSHTIAALIKLVLSAVGLVLIVPILPRGADAVARAGDSPPYFILVMSLFTNVLALLSVYGVWRSKKWGVVLMIILSVIEILSSLPGLLFAPTMDLKFVVIGTVSLNALIIFLLLRRERQLALA